MAVLKDGYMLMGMVFSMVLGYSLMVKNTLNLRPITIPAATPYNHIQSSHRVILWIF